jgi:hypothetical protein
MKGYNYLEFPPGTNIWKKSVRFLALNFERIGVLTGYFLVSDVALSKAFSYQFTLSKFLFCAVMVTAAIYSILPAPSNPNSMVFLEVFVRGPKVIMSQSLRGTMRTDPIEEEE